MPKIKLKCYGPLTDLVGTTCEIETTKNKITVKQLKKLLSQKYPIFKENINSIAIAKNDEIAQDCDALTPKDEISLLPPVSGG